MFSPDSLNLLPTPALASLSDAMTAKASSDASDLSTEEARRNRLDGTVEVSTSTGGKITTKQTNAKETALKYAGFAFAAASVAGLAKTLLDGGQSAYAPSSLPSGTVADSATVNQMNDEVLAASPISTTGPLSQAKNVEMAMAEAKISSLTQELNDTLETLNQVNEVISKRASGELPNPVVNVSDVSDAIENIIAALEASGPFTQEQIDLLRAQATAAADTNLDRFEEYVENRIYIPYSENKVALDAIKAQILGTTADTSATTIFDTVYGPPVSTTGQYLLSEDGIYYDSRSGSIPFITAEKITSTSWEMKFAANRGGAGLKFKSAQADKFADTVFSFEWQEEDEKVKDFYKYDDVLQNLKNDRDLQIQDVSGKVSDLKDAGYAASSAVVKNYEESYAAVAHTYDRKIKRRKKQLQLAAFFGPFGVTKVGDVLGEGLFFQTVSKYDIKIPDDSCGYSNKVETLSFSADTMVSSTEFIPRIPVNDFSYLKGVLLPSVELQENVLLHSEDLDDTTAPIVPVLLRRGPGANTQGIPELSLGNMGTADWVNTSGNTEASSFLSGTLSGIAPYLRTLDDSIVVDGLVACYNFLDSTTVDPSSNTYQVKNYVDNGGPLAAKLVGDASNVFVSGVTIPYLEGTLYNPRIKYGSRYAHLPKGSYVRLPNNYRDNKAYPASQPIDDLMYGKEGWSIEFWSHMGTGLSSDLTDDWRYRLVAANENCGEESTSRFMSNINTVGGSNNNSWTYRGTGKTRGMIIGWRDRGEPGTTPSGLEFVVCPTVSQNDPAWGKSVVIQESVSGGGAATCVTELGFKVPIAPATVSGYTIGQASGSFAHYSITCNPKLDAITLYVNGQFLASGTTSTLFDSYPGVPLNIPTKLGEGHFQEPYGLFGEKLYDGDLPQAPIFTPWILGGGFTDGIDTSPFTVVGNLNTTFAGFLGTNTNTSYYTVGADAGGGPRGQHSNAAASIPGLGGYTKTGSNYKLARSGLNGHLGSFKMYSKPLSKEEVVKNYKAQGPYFEGIQLPKRLL